MLQAEKETKPKLQIIQSQRKNKAKTKVEVKQKQPQTQTQNSTHKGKITLLPIQSQIEIETYTTMQAIVLTKNIAHFANVSSIIEQCKDKEGKCLSNICSKKISKKKDAPAAALENGESNWNGLLFGRQAKR